MNIWQPQQLPPPPQPPQQQQSHVALGALIALAVVGAAIALLTALDRRDGYEPGLGAAVSELHDARVELQASANELRDAAATLKEASRTFERRATTVNILDVMAPPAPPPAPPTPESSTALCGLQDDAVACSDVGHCRISRHYINELLGDPSKLTRHVRVMPSVKDGVVRGFKFYDIRPGSLPKLIGMRNGDLLTAVNGLPLTSIDQTIGAAGRLRRADELRLAIERKGEPLTLVLTIID